MESLVVVWWFILIVFSLNVAYADYQVDALNAFKNKILDDPSNAMQSWNPTFNNPCTWFHINCDIYDNVTSIDLGGASLSGQLAPELGQLKYLQKLELYDNNLDGQIPEEIGNLANLISLDLYNNNLSGPIPDSLGKLTKLVFFRIERNNLTGPIPLAIPRFKDLTEVAVGVNGGLCGPFTGRCIDRDDPHKCTDDYRCPCRCGPTFSIPCEFEKIPINRSCLCC